MFNRLLAKEVYKYIELGKFDKLSALIRGKDLTDISLVAIADVLTKNYDYPVEVLQKQGAIVDIDQLMVKGQYCLNEIKTNSGLKDTLKSIKQGMEQIIRFWKFGKLHNTVAEKYLSLHAIEVMQSPTLYGAKEVENYIEVNIKKQLTEIHGKWFTGAVDVDKETKDFIDDVVNNRLYAIWKYEGTLDESVSENLSAIYYQLLFDEYQLGNMQTKMTEIIENAVIVKLLSLLSRNTLGQYPKLHKLLHDTKAILLNGDSPFEMEPIFRQAFQKIVTDCRNGLIGGEVRDVIKSHVTEVIKASIFPVEQVTAFEKRAIGELIGQFRRNPKDFAENCHEIVLMASLPANNVENAEKDKIYVSEIDGCYVVCDQNGYGQKGYLDLNICDLSNLNDRLNDPLLRDAILKCTSNDGYTTESFAEVIKSTVLDCLNSKNDDDKEFGAAIKNHVINMLLADWKSIDSPELAKSLESIVMRECNELIEKIDNSISTAGLISEVAELKEKNIKLEIRLNELSVPKSGVSSVGLFGQSAALARNQVSTPVPTTSSTPTPQGGNG